MIDVQDQITPLLREVAGGFIQNRQMRDETVRYLFIYLIIEE